MCNTRGARGLLGYERAVQLLFAGWLGLGSWQLIALVFATSLLSLVNDAVREENKAVCLRPSVRRCSLRNETTNEEMNEVSRSAHLRSMFLVLYLKTAIPPFTPS